MSTSTQREGTPENEETRPLGHNPIEAEGRRIGGEGLDHEQDYIQERLTHAGNADEYAEAADRLKQASEDIARMPQKPTGS